MEKRQEKQIVLENSLLRIYDILFKRFGPQHWWPGDTPFEIVLGAILTQNTSWLNVTKAIQNIKNNGCLEPEALYHLNINQLAGLIKPSGYYKIKAQRIKAFMDHLYCKHYGSLEHLFAREINTLRKELLGIKGIGHETADSIILYAANKPIFVVDAYTRRIFYRHGFFPEKWPYERIQSFFMDILPKSAEIYNEYHALIVKLGKEYCKKKFNCQECPLRENKH